MSDLSFLAQGSFKTGERWTYLGRATECLNCEHERFCHSGLTPGDTFLVTEDKKTRIYCALRESEVMTVTIRREAVAALQTKIAEVGLTTRYEPVCCDSFECQMADYCSSGPASGAMIKVEEVLKTFNCHRHARRCITLSRVTILQTKGR